MNDISGILKKQVFFKIIMVIYQIILIQESIKFKRRHFLKSGLIQNQMFLTNDKKFVERSKRWFLELYGFHLKN